VGLVNDAGVNGGRRSGVEQKIAKSRLGGAKGKKMPPVTDWIGKKKPEETYLAFFGGRKIIFNTGGIKIRKDALKNLRERTKK